MTSPPGSSPSTASTSTAGWRSRRRSSSRSTGSAAPTTWRRGRRGVHARVRALARALERCARAPAPATASGTCSRTSWRRSTPPPSEAEQARAHRRARAPARAGGPADRGGRGRGGAGARGRRPGWSRCWPTPSGLPRRWPGATRQRDVLAGALRRSDRGARTSARAARYEAGLEAEPGRLDEVEERLDLYDRLERKHGGTVERRPSTPSAAAPSWRARGHEAALQRIDHELAAARAELDAGAAELGAARARRPRALPRRRRESPAGDGGREFEMRLERRESRPRPGPTAWSSSSRPSRASRLAPLRDTASGGEPSRVMLALMGVANDGPGTLVFDEVDAGIGGQTARAVGEKLRKLAHGAPGRVHHPPAADRVPRRAALLDRQGAGRRRSRGHASSGWRATPWSRSCAGCWARTPRTAARAGTPRNCWPPPERSADRRMPASSPLGVLTYAVEPASLASSVLVALRRPPPPPDSGSGVPA